MEDLIVLLVIFGVVSTFTRNVKKNIKPQRPTQNQQRTVDQRPTQNRSQTTGQRPTSSRYQSTANPQSRPTQRNEATEALESMQDGFGRLVKRLTGEDLNQEKNRKLAKMEEERRYKERVDMEKERLAQEAFDLSREEAIRWSKENEDPNEIGDLEELADIITDEIGMTSQTYSSTIFNLSEAKQGIIWAEVLARPKPLQKNTPKPS